MRSLFPLFFFLHTLSSAGEVTWAGGFACHIFPRVDVPLQYMKLGQRVEIHWSTFLNQQPEPSTADATRTATGLKARLEWDHATWIMTLCIEDSTSKGAAIGKGTGALSS